MSTATLRCSLGDLPIVSGSLRLPVLGPWYAALEVHAPTATSRVSGAVSLFFTREDGAVDTFVGTVAQAELDPGSLTLAIEVVGGAGKLDVTLPAFDHANSTQEIPAGLVARGICNATGTDGEALDDGIEAALDTRKLRRWTRLEGTAREALDLFTAILGYTWRITPAGKVWIGIDEWPDGASVPRVGFGLGDGSVVIAPNGAPALPGTTITAIGSSPIKVRAVEVLYQIQPGKLRATVRAAVAGDPPRQPVLTRYRAPFSARVVTQDASGLLEVVADDAALGTLRAVPLRCSIPGARITYNTPSAERVRIYFDGADPRGAYADAHDQAAADEQVRGVARDRDAVSCGSLSAQVDITTGAVAFTLVSPDGVSSTVGVYGQPITLTGWITRGSSEVKIR